MFFNKLVFCISIYLYLSLFILYIYHHHVADSTTLTLSVSQVWITLMCPINILDLFILIHMFTSKACLFYLFIELLIVFLKDVFLLYTIIYYVYNIVFMHGVRLTVLHLEEWFSMVLPFVLPPCFCLLSIYHI